MNSKNKSRNQYLPTERLFANYKKCICGEKLCKRNRFAVKMEAPKHINTKKRVETGNYFTKTIVIYCCEKCYKKLKKNISNSFKKGWEGFYIYYDDKYPV
jgi:hypothetical protein